MNAGTTDEGARSGKSTIEETTEEEVMKRIRQNTRLAAVLLMSLAAAFVGCGGGSEVPPPPSSNPPPGSNVASVSLAITDAPPAGVSVLTFEATITGAVLQPGNVQLITTLVPIEVKRLEVDPAILSTLNVPAGTYTSLAVSFSVPELTIRNDSNATIAPICAVGAVCEFKPTVTGTFTFSGAPFPLTITAGNPTGLLIDVNLNNLITGANTVDFNAAGALAAVQFAFPLDLGDVKGRISAVGASASEFSLQLGSGRTLLFRVDANTQFEDFNDPSGINCAANNFTCFMVGQVVEVDARLMAGGLLLAREVKAIDNDLEEELEGIVVDTSNVPASFDMVITDEALNAAGVEVGQRVRVNLVGTVRFKIDDDNLPVNPAEFDAAFHLRVGQAVEVERRSTVSVSGTPPVPVFDTDGVTLKDTRLTGRVQSVNPAGTIAVMDLLPTLFGVTTLEVRVTPALGLTPTCGVNEPASVQGLLFQGATSPFLMAKKIKGRGPGAGCWDY